MQSFLEKQVKDLVEFTPVFALVVKFIFSGEKAVKPTHSFNKKFKDCPKVVYVEVRRDQALQVISAMRKIIKSQQFTEIYNVKVYFSP